VLLPEGGQFKSLFSQNQAQFNRLGLENLQVCDFVHLQSGYLQSAQFNMALECTFTRAVVAEPPVAVGVAS